MISNTNNVYHVRLIVSHVSPDCNAHLADMVSTTASFYSHAILYALLDHSLILTIYAQYVVLLAVNA